MLIENVNGVKKASSMMKNSSFYIEVAKFVQAYTTIISNPNEFLAEIHEPAIDEEKTKLTWEQFVKIVQKCELGFSTIPTATDLVVYYNYALEIGTINPKEQRVASVDDIADAQKHYYNFVDDAKDRAEAEYYKQKRITAMREKESAEIDNKLSSIKAKNSICFAFMMIACALGGFGFVSLIFDNSVARTIGSIIPVWNEQYIGAIIFIVLAFLIFALFDKLYIKTKSDYIKLKQASATIFDRVDENYLIEKHLKRKLNVVTKDFKVVEAELKDKTKKFDVKQNIETLKNSNKYYKRLAGFENEYVASGQELQSSQEVFSSTDDQSEFAPVKLTKEQEENLRTVSKEAIKLEGQIDMDAYNEKFEKSSKKAKEKEEETQENAEQKEEQKSEEELLESIDFIKNVLGFANNQQQNEEDIEKSK